MCFKDFIPNKYAWFSQYPIKKIYHLGDKWVLYVLRVFNANLSIDMCVMCLVNTEVLFNPSIKNVRKIIL